ncbi:MAG: hypothetical protein DRI70_09925, partial [Bacteroidetes bacterium]
IPEMGDWADSLAATSSSPDLQAPSVPKGIAAVSVTSNTIRIVWEPSTDNIQVEGYHVHANGLLKGTAFTNSFTITQLNPGISYDISVSAYDAASNESVKSIIFTQKTVNPDVTLEPTMPSVRKVNEDVKGTHNIITVSEVTALGHTELHFYGVRYSEDKETVKEKGEVVTGNPIADSVTHKNRVNDGLVLLYDFSEGMGSTEILDRFDTLNPINLTIDDELAVNWLPGQGMKSSFPIPIHTEVSPTKLFGEFSSTNEITLETWIRPGLLDQSGPVKIVTLSSGADSRAFSLMQEGNVSDFEYVVRLNTSTNDENGSPELATDQDFFTLGLHHVV